VTSLTTTTVAMFCSVLFRKTSRSMITVYMVAIVMFVLPVAAKWFSVYLSGLAVTEWIPNIVFTSPFAAAFSLPLAAAKGEAIAGGGWAPWTCAKFLLFYVVLDTVLVCAMILLFRIRWRASVAPQ